MNKLLPKCLVTGLAVIVLTLSAYRIYLGNALVAVSRSVVAVDQEIQAVAALNQDMRQKIASFSSLQVIESQARELGLTQKPESLVLWQDRLPVAFRN